jgi:L-lactate dehydrogenase
VGTATVNMLVRDGHVSDVYLLDLDKERCMGEVLDLADVGFLHRCRVHMGTYEQARDSDIVVISAGAKQQPGEARTALIDRNAQCVPSAPKPLARANGALRLSCRRPGLAVDAVQDPAEHI